MKWNKYVTLRQLVDPSGKYIGHKYSRNIISNIGKQSLSNGRFGILIAVLMWDFYSYICFICISRDMCVVVCNPLNSDPMSVICNVILMESQDEM